MYKTEDGKEIYRLEKTRGLEYNRFFLKVFLELNNGQRLVLYPYEFVLKSSKTVKGKHMDPLRFLTAPAYAALVQASNNIYLPLGNVGGKC